VLIVQTPKTEIDLAAKDSYDITRLKDKVISRRLPKMVQMLMLMVNIIRVV
jgi:endoglucanase